MEEEHEGYDGPAERSLLEFEKTKDPSLGYVPIERLWTAMDYTENLKRENNYRTLSLLWIERGPIFDSVGPANGNGRGGGGGFTGGYTSGRITAVFVDTLGDPTGNTVFCGGVAGGLWKCTNFLSATPNWIAVNDFLSNLAIASICQDPTNANIMYFSTGEGTLNADAVKGNGVWKSIDHGSTWTILPTSSTFTRSFKILCDASGNVFLATGGFGLRRSNDKGGTWTNITPAGLTASNPNWCTDIEISSTGKLHASFGYVGTIINYRYTTTPATVSSGAGWNTGVGIRISGVAAYRLELACIADTLYGVTVESSFANMDSCYKSIDGGATWTKQNTIVYTNSLGSGQGWYSCTLAINPANANEIIIGGLDAYRSIDSGRTISKISAWVGAGAYVHADHHFIQWWKAGAESRVLIASDGGIFLSRDGGSTFSDKNRNLAIKQFYSCAIHPTLTDYILGGAQDNGSHQLKNPGLSYSIEVQGGDGGYVAIDQKAPNYQFVSYVYNQYRRSTDGGLNWTTINISSTTGMFINPYDYDDQQKKMYCGNAPTPSGTNNQLRRWDNPQTGALSTILTLSAMGTSNSSAFQTSPYTPNRVYIGTTNGRLLILDNADTVTQTYADANTTNITGASFPAGGFLNCVAVGTDDNHLLAIFSNYGVSNIWYTSNGGGSWTAIEGTGVNALPDMPVRWAVFNPGNDNRSIIATEAGVYTTNLINGASTEWLPSPGFPLVRTDMLKIRKSDNTIVAATHGRGLFTANTLAVLPIRSIKLEASLQPDGRSLLKWVTVDATAQTRYHLQYSNDGVSFTEIADLSENVKQYSHDLNSQIAYYRIMAAEPNQAPVFSNTVQVKTSKPLKGLQLRILPNPVSSSANLVISSSEAGSYAWQLMDIRGQMLKSGIGVLAQGGSRQLQVNAASLPSGIYRFRVVQDKHVAVSSFVKQ